MSDSNKEQRKCFERETEEAKYTSEKSLAYVFRFCKRETCNDSPWGREYEHWPTIEVEGQKNLIVGAVYEAGKKCLVGVWAADPGDGHVEYYVRDDVDTLFEGEIGATIREEMDNITGILSQEICEEYKDVLDDGSGITRDAIVIPAASFINCHAIADFYEDTLDSVAGEKRKRDNESADDK